MMNDVIVNLIHFHDSIVGGTVFCCVCASCCRYCNRRQARMNRELPRNDRRRRRPRVALRGVIDVDQNARAMPEDIVIDAICM